MSPPRTSCSLTTTTGVRLWATARMSQSGGGYGAQDFTNMRNSTTSENGAPSFSGLSSVPRSYALSGKIMLSAIVILFTVVLLILCLHVYARWYLLRRARIRRRTRRRLVFTAEQEANGAAANRGLDPEVIMSLPAFTYSVAKCAVDSNDMVECAVCLSEFQENEKLRRLPRCKHNFHIDCIDMWFSSHATCPLCRSTVEQLESPLPASASIHIRIEAPPTLDLCDSCRLEDVGSPVAAAFQTSGSSSSLSSSATSPSPGARQNISGRCALNRIEVPSSRGADGFRITEEDVGSSPGPAQSSKSPISRMASLKRILSFDLRFYRGGCSSHEPDLERGGAADAETPRTPAPHPQR